MSSPRFSIVIPTCDRHETLYHTIRTALNQQDFEDYEIIISDNFSSPFSKEIVEQFNSDKIRYIRTPRRMAMTNNFEFAVSHCEGEYVIVIGDDDGLMPDALSNIDRLAKTTGHKAIRWESSHYYWPNMRHPGKRNIAAFTEGAQELVFESEVTIDNVINYEINYSFLPMLYHAAIHRDVIQAIRERAGRVFNSRSPDVYSGFAVAYFVKHYLYCAQPYSIMGLSAKSNGWAYILNQNELTRDFESTNAVDAIRCHPQIPEIPSLHACVLDSFLYAKEALFPERQDLTYDEKCFIIGAMAENYRKHDIQTNVQDFRTALADRPALLHWFETVVVPNLATIMAEAPQAPPISCIARTVCDLNVAEAYGIEDVYELARNYRQIVAEQKALQPAQSLA